MINIASVLGDNDTAPEPEHHNKTEIKPDFFLVMRALFNEGHPAGELPAALVLWAEENHALAYQFLTLNLGNPVKIRECLAGIYRKMSRSDDWDQAHLEEAERNDGVSAMFLKPFIDKDAAGMAEVNGWDKTWRGIRDDLDRAACEVWHESLKNNP